MLPKTSMTALFKPPKAKFFTKRSNLLGFLLSKKLATFVFNPLQTNQFRKSLSLRKTKTDKVDAMRS
ncbi:MAG: transposase [Quinella sp. 3Q1]|nr:transposase [Quinella sp. 3Q1]MBR6887651.1 transposase [Selenomonadaceae bacterium]